MDQAMYTLAPDTEVLHRGGQHVLINPATLEWIKLGDEAYKLVENRRRLPLGELAAAECLERGGNAEEIGALFDYLLDAGLIVEAARVAKLARAHFNVTDRCNLGCKACYFAARGPSGADPLGTDEVCAVLDALVRGRPRSLVISGGEPFLREDIGEILAFAGARFDEVVLLTNGCLIGDEEADQVREAGARVQVSIESADEPVHDSVRGKGSFGAAMDGVRTLLHAGVGDIEIVPTLTRKNVAGMLEVARLANELGVGHHFSLFMPVGRGACHASDLTIPAYELLRCLALLVDETRAKSLEECTPADLGSPVDLCAKRGCGAGHEVISVGPDGRVYPCPLMHHPDMCLGILPEDPLWEICRRGKRLVPDVTQIPGCADCDVAYFCGGGCRAHSFTQYRGGLVYQDPYCEFYRAAYRAVLWEWRDDRPFDENVRALVTALVGNGDAT